MPDIIQGIAYAVADLFPGSSIDVCPNTFSGWTYMALYIDTKDILMAVKDCSFEVYSSLGWTLIKLNLYEPTFLDKIKELVANYLNRP